MSDSSLLCFHQNSFGIKLPTKVNMPLNKETIQAQILTRKRVKLKVIPPVLPNYVGGSVGGMAVEDEP